MGAVLVGLVYRQSGAEELFFSLRNFGTARPRQPASLRWSTRTVMLPTIYRADYARVLESPATVEARQCYEASGQDCRTESVGVGCRNSKFDRHTPCVSRV